MLMLMMSVCQCNAKEEQDMRIICIAASIADIMFECGIQAKSAKLFQIMPHQVKLLHKSCRHNVR